MTRSKWRCAALSFLGLRDLPYIVMHREPKTIASRPCTPSSTLEMFGEIISASPGSSKEIAGLLRKMMMMMMMMMMMI